MLSRRPVLAVKRSGMDRVIKNVMYYESLHNYEEIKYKIEYLLKEKELRENLAADARIEVERYTFDKMVELFTGERRLEGL